MEGKVVKETVLRKEVFSDSCCCCSSLFYSELFFSSFIIRRMPWWWAALGKQALAAVGGSTSTLINLLVGFFVDCPAVLLWSYLSFTVPKRRIRSTGPYIHPLLFPLLGALSL